VQLYIRRVFIMSDCRDLIPEYMRFMRGVVDSEDLPLNVSREILQEDRQTAIIKRGLTRKVLETLKRVKADDPDAYKRFWDMFGQVLKEGIVQDPRNRDAILKLCLVETSSEPRSTLEEYVSRMRGGQKDIYYITGGGASALRGSPKLEAFKKRGVEVLIQSDPIDEFWVTAAGKFDDREFVSVSSADVGLPDAEETEEERELAKKIEKELDDTGIAGKLKDAIAKLEGAAKSVEDVKLSARLVDSPATFVQKGGAVTPQMRAMFKAMGQEMPEEKRVLEINPSHPLIRKIADASEDDYADWATILLGLAQAADGEPVEDAGTFTKALSKMLGA
jgi:molecular chaperone HtpG